MTEAKIGASRLKNGDTDYISVAFLEVVLWRLGVVLLS